MYISRIALNTYRTKTMTALASPQVLHATVESSFPPGIHKQGRNLWRVERLGDALYLLVLSSEKPDFSHIIDQFGWPNSEQTAETKDYSRLLNQIETGQLWRFRLRANPVHSAKTKGDLQRGKVYAHVTVKQQEQWLIERSEKYGFNIEKDSFRVVQREQQKFIKRGNRVFLGTATYEGVLKVLDAKLFKNTLVCGIGRAKAYGCGLLTVIKLS